MKLLGQLRKMNAEAQNPVTYFLNLDKTSYPLNPHIGKPIRLKWTGTITCIECGIPLLVLITKANDNNIGITDQFPSAQCIDL